MVKRLKFEPVTERQIELMEKLGIEIPEGLSKQDASALISEAIERKNGESEPLSTDAQKRRLRFFDLQFDDHTTKREATGMIDDWLTSFPEDEERYQGWKEGLPTSDPFGEFTPRDSESVPKFMITKTEGKPAKKIGPFGCGCLSFFAIALVFAVFMPSPPKDNATSVASPSPTATPSAETTPASVTDGIPADESAKYNATTEPTPAKAKKKHRR